MTITTTLVEIIESTLLIEDDLLGSVTVLEATGSEVSVTLLEEAVPGPAGPAGPSGGVGSIVAGEIPVGLINGSNGTFTTAFSFVPETFEVFINGLRQKLIEDYNTSGGNSFTLISAPLTDEEVLVGYTRT